MHEALKELTRLRAISLAALSILIYLSGVILVGSVISLILSAIPAYKLDPEEAAWFTAGSFAVLTVSLIVFQRNVMSVATVAQHLRQRGFHVIKRHKRLEASKTAIQLSLFLESTWRAYDISPSLVFFRKGGKWRTRKEGGYDPSYMYQEGILQIVRHETTPDKSSLQEQLRRKVPDVDKYTAPAGITVIANRRVGAWMGKHLLREIDAALAAA